jgi:thiol-disulfide isomerase/thioredoxin
MRSDRMERRSSALAAGLALACLVVTGAGKPARAQVRGSVDPSPGDVDAHMLFGEVAKTYQALTSYSDQGQFHVAMTLGGKAHRQDRPLKLTIVRPNKFDLDAGAVRLTSDGKTMATVIEPLKKYMTAPAPETVGIDTFREGPTGAILFGGQAAAPTSAPVFVLLSLLSGTNPDVMLDQMGGTLHEAKAGGGKPDKAALLIDLQEGPDLLLRVDPATRLLSAIELKIDPAQLAKSTPPGQTLSIDQFGWTAGTVSTNVAADRSFAFVAPKGFAAIEGPKEQPGGAAQAPQYAVQEKLGKLAPDFTLTLLDGEGKTRTVTRAELAGKVVVIDFWATWCGPCLMELPEIQKVVEQYKGATKEVLIVALSQDSEPQEISEVRKLVEKTLAGKKIDLTRAPVGRIGLDPSNSVGKAFEVEGYPTLVILDGKGIVQSAHVGYNPDAAEPLHKTLATEIDALLEGKSLVGDKGKNANESKQAEDKR